MRIVAYRNELADAVKAFNARLGAGGVPFRFPESPMAEQPPGVEGREASQERFVAMDDGVIRGGYILSHQPFWVNGQIRLIGCLRLPISEGIIDKTYGRLGAYLFADATRRQPLLYLLGMGGTREPVVRMLRSMGWPAKPVPFYFRIVRPATVLRQIVYLRTSRLQGYVLDALAGSGLGWALIRLGHTVRRPARAAANRVDAEVVHDVGDWCDELWERCANEYAMIGVRNRTVLRMLYSKEIPRFIRIKVTRAGVAVGWAVMLATQMTAHKQFGDMKVGSIVDCLSRPHDAGVVVRAATHYLEDAGVDLIVSNQSAVAWRRAFRENGYLRGPSNFVFSASKELARLLDPLERSFRRLHLTRGDGEGPTNL